MSVETTTPRVSYAGNGTTTVFSIPFQFLGTSDIVILLVDADGTEHVKTLLSGLSSIDGGGGDTGSVTFSTAPAVGETVVIYNDPALTQGLDLTEGDASPAESKEQAWDRLTLICQRLSDRMDRAMRLPEGYSDSFDLDLPSPLTASRIIGTNSDGDGLTLYDLADGTAVALPGSSGIAVYTGSSTFTARTITAGSGIAVTNGTGVSGDPTIALDVSGLTEDTAPAIGDYLAGYDISGASSKKQLVGSLASTIVSSAQPMVNGLLSVSIASNVLSVSVKGRDGNAPSATNPVYFLLRDPTATTGDYVVRKMTGEPSVTLGTTDSIGQATAVASYFYVYAVDTDGAGTIELFVSLHPFWDEGVLQNTSTTGTSNAVLFGGSAVTGKAVRLIGRFKATWTSGTGWGSLTEVTVAPFPMPSIGGRFYKTSDESFTSSATLQVMTLQGVTADDLNCWSGNNTYTVAAPGRYLIFGSGIFKIGAVSFNFAAAVVINGSNKSLRSVNGTAWGGGGYYPGFALEYQDRLVAGDIIHGYAAQQNSGASSYSLAGEASGTSTWLDVLRLGD